MLQSIWDDIRREFNFGNMISKLIIVNVAVWIIINIIWVFTQWGGGNELYQEIVHYFAVSNGWDLLYRPWTLLTHMFTHEGFFHILGNMLFLYWFGRIFGDLLGDDKVLPLYLTGGFVGFLFYFVGMHALGIHDSYALGASGAVACILLTTGIFAPDYGIRLLFFGTVKLKWIVAAAVFMQFLGLGTMDNIGGTIDHIGGMFFGALYATQLRKGNDLLAPTKRLLNWIGNTYTRLVTPSRDHKKRRGPKVSYRRDASSSTPSGGRGRPSFMRKATGGRKTAGRHQSDDGEVSTATHQEQLDAILDKIKERGYNSLSKEEKDFLFRASNK